MADNNLLKKIDQYSNITISTFKHNTTEFATLDNAVQATINLVTPLISTEQLEQVASAQARNEEQSEI